MVAAELLLNQTRRMTPRLRERCVSSLCARASTQDQKRHSNSSGSSSKSNGEPGEEKTMGLVTRHKSSCKKRLSQRRVECSAGVGHIGPLDQRLGTRTGQCTVVHHGPSDCGKAL